MTHALRTFPQYFPIIYTKLEHSHRNSPNRQRTQNSVNCQIKLCESLQGQNYSLTRLLPDSHYKIDGRILDLQNVPTYGIQITKYSYNGNVQKETRHWEAHIRPYTAHRACGTVTVRPCESNDKNLQNSKYIQIKKFCQFLNCLKCLRFQLRGFQNLACLSFQIICVGNSFKGYLFHVFKQR